VIWLLVVIYLNLSVVPPHIEHGEIVGSFQSEQACNKKQREFVEQAKNQNLGLPDNFNLGCIPFKRSIM
jgi:hypothetical protein